MDNFHIIPLIIYIIILCIISLISKILSIKISSINQKQNLILISISSLWFSISVSITIFNKFLFSYLNGGGFHYPFLSTSIQVYYLIIR